MYIFGDVSSAKRAFSRISSAGTRNCLADEVTKRAEGALKIGKITSAQAAMRPVGDESALGRLTIPLKDTTTGQHGDLFGDLVFARVGRGIAILSFGDLKTPFDEAMRDRLTRTLVARLKTGLMSGGAPVLTRMGLCKKPGIHYVGRSAEGVKVCFTLNSEGTKLIESGWIFARESGSGCSGIPKNALPGSVRVSSSEHAGTSSQRFEADVLSGTIRDANGSLLSEASGLLSDPDDCPGKTFEWTAYRTPSRVARSTKEERALLPKMVIPDASLARLADGARKRFAFYTNPNDAAASTFDPNDTGADLRRMGRIAGYIRGRNVAGAFAKRAPEGLLVTNTSVILWKDGRSAAASIKRDLASGKRFSGKRLQGGVLVSYAARKLPLLGAEAVLEHVRTRPTGGTDRFATGVLFHVGSLRASAIVARGDRFADRAALQVAKQLKLRVVAVLRSSH